MLFGLAFLLSDLAFSCSFCLAFFIHTCLSFSAILVLVFFYCFCS
jgi:hypothetical protein